MDIQVDINRIAELLYIFDMENDGWSVENIKSFVEIREESQEWYLEKAEQFIDGLRN